MDLSLPEQLERPARKPQSNDAKIDLLSRARELAKEIFGIKDLYPHQEQALLAFLSGKDAVVITPTGGGKTLCYVLPALLAGGMTVVVSPLIALIRDQVRRLSEVGIPAVALDSFQELEEQQGAWDEVQSGLVKVLFVSPERLARPSFRERLLQLPIALVAIDEAHCISQWGFNFRPEYRRIGEYINDFSGARRMALTATAPGKVIEELKHCLQLDKPQMILAPVTRQNLKLEIIKARTVDDQKQMILTELKELQGAGIIYAPTRKKVDELAQALLAQGFSAAGYHAGLAPMVRKKVQKDFLQDRLRLVVATNSFGLGIDKPNVRFVLHYGLPANLEQYVQEVGRAGRDGREARCRLYYGPRDYFIQKFMLDKSYPDLKMVESVFTIVKDLCCGPLGVTLNVALQKASRSLSIDRRDIQGALSLLVREGLLQHQRPTEIDDVERLFFHPMGEADLSGSFWRDYPRRKQLQIDKLATMLSYVKAGKERQQMMSQYFAVEPNRGV